MKPAVSLALITALSAGPALAARHIVWVTDNLQVSTNIIDDPGDAVLEDGPYPDTGFVNLLRSAGYTVTRFNPPQSNNPPVAANVPLSEADVTFLNSADLVIIGRCLLSSAFDSNAETWPWNVQITKPLLSTNVFLSRRVRLGWFGGSGNGETAGHNSAAGTPNPVVQFNFPSGDPVSAYLIGNTPMTGTVTDGTMYEAIPPNGPGGGWLNTTSTTPGTIPTEVAGAFDRGQNFMATANTVIPGCTVLATTVSPFASVSGANAIATWQAGSSCAGSASFDPSNTAVQQVLGGFRMLFPAGNQEPSAATAIGNAGFENLTPEAERLFLRAVALTMNAGSVPADADDDGVPDTWETTHFTGPATTTGAGDDDGDGLNNLIEYAFNLNPKSGDQSTFSLGTMVNGLMEISITKQPYISYVVEHSTDLQTWTQDDVANDGDGLITVANDASTLRVREAAAGNRRTFRVRIYPMPLP
jgi:hypothetical protein